MFLVWANRCAEIWTGGATVAAVGNGVVMSAEGATSHPEVVGYVSGTESVFGSHEVVNGICSRKYRLS